MTNAVVKVEERDAAGLTLVERRLLQEIALTGDFKKAAVNMGTTPTQIRRLLREDPQFKEAYDEMFSIDDLKHTESELQLAVADVATVFNEAKEAMMVRSVQATCPCGCGTTFKVAVTVADWATRLRAAEDLAKITRVWKDQRNIKVEGQINVVHLSIADQIAMQAIENGRRVPAHVYSKLQDYARSANVSLPPNGTAIEGEFREIDDGDTEADPGLPLHRLRGLRVPTGEDLPWL